MSLDDDLWAELDRLNNPSLDFSPEAQAISRGHAFNEHMREFPEFSTQDDFARHIDNIINKHSNAKELGNGRTAYWDDVSGTVVIIDPGDIDGGTAFRPTDGKNYFSSL